MICFSAAFLVGQPHLLLTYALSTRRCEDERECVASMPNIGHQTVTSRKLHPTTACCLQYNDSRYRNQVANKKVTVSHLVKLVLRDTKFLKLVHVNTAILLHTVKRSAKAAVSEFEPRWAIKRETLRTDCGRL